MSTPVYSDTARVIIIKNKMFDKNILRIFYKNGKRFYFRS